SGGNATKSLLPTANKTKKKKKSSRLQLGIIGCGALRYHLKKYATDHSDNSRAPPRS
ncbi:hypothetical protein AMECASPLE_039324, partial [Ameca splendens]